MTPAAIIQQAQAGGVRLALSPSGTIKATGDGAAVNRWLEVIREHKTEIIGVLKVAAIPDDQTQALEKLALFRFDLIRADIEAGYPASDLHRVNNMAWEFMQTDGMAFEDAIRMAADIVATTQAAACEAAYVDVMALFDRLNGRQ
ncbi:MAG: hypothetical protein JSS58_05940 [Proteobacteria bacterium]|nr:hypothetical protein [Pseudomonadota bacterium]